LQRGPRFGREQFGRRRRTSSNPTTNNGQRMNVCTGVRLSQRSSREVLMVTGALAPAYPRRKRAISASRRSEEHTSELQSLTNLVCRLLLEKKKTKLTTRRTT